MPGVGESRRHRYPENCQASAGEDLTVYTVDEPAYVPVDRVVAAVSTPPAGPSPDRGAGSWG